MTKNERAGSQCHPDHVAVGKLAFDAAFAATLPGYKVKTEGAAKMVPIYYMDTPAGVSFLPTEYVDITDEMDLKLQMLECHESQMGWMRDHDHIEFSDMVITACRYRGYHAVRNTPRPFVPAWPI